MGDSSGTAATPLGGSAGTAGTIVQVLQLLQVLCPLLNVLKVQDGAGGTKGIVHCFRDCTVLQVKKYYAVLKVSKLLKCRQYSANTVAMTHK